VTSYANHLSLPRLSRSVPLASTAGALVLAVLLSSLPAPPALAGTSSGLTIHSSMVDILFDDADDSGGASCGDEINYVIVVGGDDDSLENPSDVLWRMDVPENAEVVPGSIRTASPFEPAVILSGNDPGDRLVLVDFGELCNNIIACGPEGASMNIRLKIVSPNPLSELSVQAQVSGSNFPTILTDDLSVPGPENPTVTPYEPCPGASPAFVRATKIDSLETDVDGDGLADPGDVLRYSVNLRTLSTSTAEGLFYHAAPGPHTRLIAGTVVTDRGVVLEGNDPGDTALTIQVGTMAAGFSAAITYLAEILDPLPPGVDEVACQGLLTGENIPDLLTDDPALPGSADPTVTPIDFDPVLEVDKALLPGSDPSPGGLLPWEVTALNTGNGPAENVFLFEAVPQQTVFVAAESDPAWNCQPMPVAGTLCSLSLGTLPPDEPRTAVFAVRLADPLPAGFEELENCVGIGESLRLEGVVPVCRTVPVPGGQPDLTVTKSDSGASVEPGQAILYLLTTGNLGDRGATGVELTETVPEHTSFTAAASEPGWVCTGSGAAGDTCTLALGELPGGGASADSVFSVTVDSMLPAGVTQIDNTVTVTDDGTHGADADPTNNTATEETPLTGAMPDLGVDKALEPGSVPRPGGSLSWTITVSNTGNQGATGVELSERVPAHTTFDVASSDPGWSCEATSSGSLCTLSIGGLAAGASLSAVFAVTLAPTLPPGVDFVENCASLGSMVEGCSLVPLPEAVPDLAVEKDDAGIITTPGGTVSYQIGYSNRGTQGATGVALEDRLPEGTSLAPELSDDRWSCQPDAGGLLCRLEVGTLAAGDMGSVTLTIEVDPDLPAQVDLLTNVVRIEDDGDNGPDPNPADNEATETTPVELPEPARLEVTLADLLAFDADANGGASAGDTVGYVVRVTNVGAVTATRVVFEVSPDPNTRLAEGSVLTSQGTVVSGNGSSDSSVEVELGELVPGVGADVAFEVGIDTELPPAVRQLSVQGAGQADNADPEPSDDPDTPEDDDPTVTPIVGARDPAEIPTLSEVGLGVLVVLLASVGLSLVRRRMTHGLEGTP